MKYLQVVNKGDVCTMCKGAWLAISSFGGGVFLVCLFLFYLWLHHNSIKAHNSGFCFHQIVQRRQYDADTLPRIRSRYRATGYCILIFLSCIVGGLGLYGAGVLRC